MDKLISDFSLGLFFWQFFFYDLHRFFLLDHCLEVMPDKTVPYNIFINGVSKIRLQLYVAILSIVITIPLAIFFAAEHVHFGKFAKLKIDVIK